MFWLRALLFTAPLAVTFCAVVLFRQVSQLELPEEVQEMICVIREPVGLLNPLLPLNGTTREVTDLVFEPLLLRDDELNLIPNIVSGTRARTHVTIRCESEEAAGDSEAKLLSGEYVADGLKLLRIERDGSVITAILEGYDPKIPDQLVDGFDPENLGNFLLIKLSVSNSVRESFETFLQSSVEKSQIKMMEYESDQVVNLFAKGDIDLLLRELELYYESNRTLDPRIEEVGIRSHTSFREATVDFRRGVTWHDGQRLTADDVLFTYRLLTGPGSPLPMAGAFWFAEEIERVDDYQVRMILRDSPTILMESLEKLPVLPEHVLGGAETSEEWMAFFKNPVGNGPYRIVSRRDDGGIVLAANEQFFRGAPKQKAIVYRQVESFESKLLALRSGQIDTIDPDSRFREWTKRNPGMVKQLKCRPRFQHFVAWNMDRAPFDSKEVRLALARAVDLEAILTNSATEFQVLTKSLFFPGMNYSEEPMALPLFDPRSAENLLEKNGYLFDESKGNRVGPNGKPFLFELLVNETNETQVELANALAEHWSAVGVTVEVREMPWLEMLAEHLATREFSAMMLSWEIPLERDRYESWHSQQVELGGGNMWGLRNHVVDELLLDLRYAENEEEVRQAATELEAEIAALQPCLFVCDTGRIIWHREDAIEVAKPDKIGEYTAASMTVGRAGLERDRPWWVRIEKAKQEDSGSDG